MLTSNPGGTGIIGHSDLTFDGTVLGLTGQAVSYLYDLGDISSLEDPMTSISDIDFNLSNNLSLNVDQSGELNLINGQPGASYTIKFNFTNGGGSANLNWSNLIWINGVDFQITGYYGQVTIVNIFYDGTDYFGFNPLASGPPMGYVFSMFTLDTYDSGVPVSPFHAESDNVVIDYDTTIIYLNGGGLETQFSIASAPTVCVVFQGDPAFASVPLGFFNVNSLSWDSSNSILTLNVVNTSWFTGITVNPDDLFWFTLVAGQGAGLLHPTNVQTTDYTLQLSDVNKNIQLGDPGNLDVTVPDYATVEFPVGSQILITKSDVGRVGVTGAAGVTINSRSGLVEIDGTWGTATLLNTGTDVWNLFGDLI